jgi:hypothetical protein
MRFNFRAKILNITIFFMLSQTQTVKGITSRLRNGKHIVLWDLDKKKFTLTQIKDLLRRIQRSYGLSNIYIVSDKVGSFRAWCFSQVDFPTYIKILADSLEIIDYNFFYWTVYQGKATLRISRKVDRPEQKIVSVLESFYVPLPFDMLEKAVYDTGIEKVGMYIKLPLKEIG